MNSVPDKIRLRMWSGTSDQKQSDLIVQKLSAIKCHSVPVRSDQAT
jgi:hypothetical protein